MDADIEHPLVSQAKGAVFDARIIEVIRQRRIQNPNAFASAVTLSRPDLATLVAILSTTIREFPHSDKHLLEIYGKVVVQGIADGSLGVAYRSGLYWDFLHQGNADSSFVPEDGVPVVPRSRGRGLKSAFEAEYRGDTHKLLIDILKGQWELRRGDEPAKRFYNLAVPVVQSPGMGKSRMIHEASKLVFTIPINLGDRLGERAPIYPPPDDGIRQYFLAHVNASDIELQTDYAILLRVLFDEVVRLLDTDSFQGLSGELLAREWSEYLGEGGTEYIVGANRRSLLNTVAGRARSVKRDVTSEQRLNRLLSSMEKSCWALLKAISRTGSPDTDFCYVSFDEVHMLTNPRDEPSTTRTRSPYDNLGKVLVSLASHPIFFIFLSTKFQFQKAAPRPTNMLSCLIINGIYLFPPFTELPFDLFKEDTVGPLAEHQELTLENVCKTDVIVGFGRGLWYPYHQYWSKNRGPHVLELALAKFVGTTPNVDPFKPRIAALSARIGIALNMTTQSSRAMETELVDSYMRVVYAIPEHREHMCSGSSSEPVLANAAAEYLNRGSNRDGIQTIGPEVLAEAVKRGLLVTGQRTVLCGRMLLTAAHDIAIKRIENNYSLSKFDPRFHQPIPVLEFLRALFPEESHGKILDAQSITRAQGVRSLGAAFANSFVSFSHFALAGNSHALSTPYLGEALIRGMAFYVRDDQCSIDAVIPIHMGPVTSRISCKAISAINLQFTDRKDIHPCRVDRTITVPDFNTPVLSIVFEFGAEEKDLDITSYDGAICDGIDQTDIDDHHYQIVAHGCGSKAFAAVPREIETHYSSVLGGDPVIQDFPRSNEPRSLRALHNMRLFSDENGFLQGYL